MNVSAAIFYINKFGTDLCQEVNEGQKFGARDASKMITQKLENDDIK